MSEAAGGGGGKVDPASLERLSLGAVLRDAVVRVDLSRIPVRILAAIRKHDQSSEVLIKLVHLSILAIWAVLYAISPKRAGVPFAPVPYVLAAYFVVNAFGLWWAVKRPLPDWAVYGFIVVEVGLLMLLIWSFHIQYQQPPSFYLKAPTLLYVFIYVALRALRYEARFVLAAGVASVLGWLTLVAYVLYADPSRNMVTRDYVVYLTSNSLLIGAELDKIIVMVMVAGIIAMALRRANRLLVSAATETVAAHDLARFFDASVASRIRSAEAEIGVGAGSRRDAAVMFVDIRGFTSLAGRIDPSQVVSVLTAYQRRVVPLIQKHGGMIDKFLGDGIMATFGATERSESYAADALRALDEIIDTVNAWGSKEDLALFPWGTNEELALLAPGSVNIAVAAGQVVFGIIGDESRLEFTVIGAVVNRAAKLEKFNRTLGSVALTDADTYALAKRQGYLPATEARHLRQSVAGAEELVILREGRPISASVEPPGQ